ncbi:MAG: hypothetical protein IJX91_00255 [Clostridia bacterium]|nr:hypothetical protein [Clostridia bacterium]
MDLEKRIQKDWDLIKDFDILEDIEDLRKLYQEKPYGKCLRKYTAYPWSKENFFFGDNAELNKYYKTTTDIPFYLNYKIGQKFHSLTLLEFYRDEDNILMVKCRCDCGNEVCRKWVSVNDGNSRTCGCKLGRGIQQDKNEELLSQEVIKKLWDYEKNTANPENVLARSTEKYWWKNEYGQSYQLAPYVFAKNETSTSFPEQVIFFYIKQYFSDAINKAQYITADGEILEIDILIPTLQIGIEYDGAFWHKDKLALDNYKNKILNESGIFLIRVREQGLLKMEDYDGKTIIRKEPLEKNETLISTINSIFNEIKKRDTLNRSFSRISLDRMQNDISNIYAQFYNTPVENSIANSNLMPFWDIKKNKLLDSKCVSVSAHIPVSFKCKQGFEKIATPYEISHPNKIIHGITCPFSGYCREFNQTHRCEIFCSDLIVRESHTKKRFWENGFYYCHFHIESEDFLAVVLNKNSSLYSTNLPYKQILKFVCFCSIDYRIKPITNKVFDFVYNELVAQNEIPVKDFFEQVRHELRAHEVVCLLENKKVCKVLVSTSTLDYCVAHLLKIKDNCLEKGFFRLPHNFVLIAEELSCTDLSDMCKLIQTKIGLENWIQYVAEIRQSVKYYRDKNRIRIETENFIKQVIGNIYETAETPNEKRERELKENVYLALNNNQNIKEILRKAIVNTYSPAREKLVYEFYTKGILKEVGEDYNINQSFYIQGLNLSFVSNAKEVLEIMEILGVNSVLYKLLDFDTNELRDRFISLIKKCYNASSFHIFCGGMNERYFEKQFLECDDKLSLVFITKLINVLEYVSSRENRPEKYTRLDAPELIEILKKRKAELLSKNVTVSYNSNTQIESSISYQHTATALSLIKSPKTDINEEKGLVDERNSEQKLRKEQEETARKLREQQQAEKERREKELLRKKEEAKKRQEAIARQKESYRTQGLCQHCGGNFKKKFLIFSSGICSRCGKKKDY